MTYFTVIGFVASAILLVALGYLLLRGKPAVRRMYLVMVLIGLGYLTATGAMEDFGRRIMGESLVPSAAELPVTPPAVQPEAATPAPAPTPTPAPTPAPDPAPAPANDNAPPADAPAAATP